MLMGGGGDVEDDAVEVQKAILAECGVHTEFEVQRCPDLRCYRGGGKHLGEQLACPGGIGVAECVEVAREGEGGGVLRVGICEAGDVPLTRALRVYAHGGEDTGWRGLSGA